MLLAEDHTIVREGIRALLEKSGDFEIAGEAIDGREAVKKAAENPIDVVLMDIRMPGLNGIEATKKLKKRFPGIKVIILSMHPDEEYVLEALQAGASGYVLKQSAHEELFLAIRAAHNNAIFLSPAISERVVGSYLRASRGKITELAMMDKLTGREREILQLIAEGKSEKEIASILFISVKTVQAHKAHLKEKLGFRRTADLIGFAFRKGIAGQV